MAPTLPEEVQAALKKPKQVFGKYVLIRELGRGGMGAVYKAWQLELRRYVAIKFLLGGGEEELKRFYREAQTAAALAHPNIAAIHEIGVQDGKHFIAMEFIDGYSLDRVKAPKSRIELLQVVEMLRDAARGVEFAHSKGVIHRDLKPANIMATREGKTYVTDFGLARRVKDEIKITGTGFIVGTPAYMSPEQAKGDREEVDRATDIYSLGATLYDLLTGRPPFQAKTALETLQKVVSAEPKAPSSIQPGIPRELEAICLKALEKKKGARYRSAGEFAEDLDRFLRNEPVKAKPASAAQRAIRFVRKRWPFFAAGAALVAIAAVWIVRQSARNGELSGLQLRARELHGQGKWKDCQSVCLQIRAQGGDNDDVRRMLADCERELKAIEDAKAKIEARERAQMPFHRGKAALDAARKKIRDATLGIGGLRKEYEKVAGLLQDALKLDPDFEEARRTLAETYNDVRDPAGIPHADWLVEKKPGDPTVYLLRAKLRLWRHLRETGAISLLFMSEPDYNRETEAKRIVDDLARAKELQLDRVLLDSVEAIGLYVNGEYEKSWTLLSEAYRKDPDDRDLLLFIGIEAWVLRSWNKQLVPEALPYLQKSHQAQPNDPFAVLMYAEETGRRDRLPDAERLLEASTDDLAVSLALAEMRARLRYFHKRDEEGRAAVDAGIRRQENGFLLLRLADNHKGTREELESVLARAKRATPLCAYNADRRLAVWLLTSRETAAEAERILDRLIAEGKFRRFALSAAEHAELLADKANCRGRLGDAEGALQWAEAATRTFPTAWSYYVCAAACFKLKRYPDSLRYAKLARDRNNPAYSGLEKEIEDFIRKVEAKMREE